MAALAAEGYRRMSLGTGNASLDQLAFYQKAGFRIAGVIPDHFVLNYPEVIAENGIVCHDMIRLSRALVAGEGLPPTLLPDGAHPP